MPSGRDELLAIALQDYEERSSAGIPPPLVDYRSQLGEAWDDFVEIVDTEADLKALLEPTPAPPLGGLFGPYELLRLLGKGATGLVYEARNTVNNRIEAVKILRPGLEAEPESLRRFHREVQLAAELEHPNIVPVYACGEVGGYPYCAMELVQGMSLRQAAFEGRLPPPEDLARGLAGIADALQTLHEKGILHRDVKPSNIMLRPDGSMVLADFGLARAADLQRITWTGQMLGTPRYMSPEQLCGRELDPRADVYGLGATLYRVLSGKPLFQAESVAALALKILRERPEDLDRVAPGVPKGLSRIVMKAVATEPGDRHESAAAMRDELLVFAGGGDPQSRPPSLLTRLGRKARRCWLPLSVAAAVIVAGVVLYLGRDARLQLQVLPARASLTLNGVEQKGKGSRFDLQADPGTWSIRVRREGFLPLEFEHDLAAGTEERLTKVLVVGDANDPVAAEALAEALNAYAVLAFDETDRSARVDVVPVFPRGKVRREDIARFRLECDAAQFEADERLTISFRRDGEELGSASVAVRADVLSGPVPAAVLEAVRLEDEIEWIVRRDGEVLAKADFTMAEIPEKAAGRWTIVEGLAKDQPAGIRAWLRGSFLMQQDFHQAAFHEMRRLGAGQKSLPPWVVAREAADQLGIAHTALDKEVRAILGGFSEDVRKRWHRGPKEDAPK